MLTWRRINEGWLHSDQSSGRWRISKIILFGDVPSYTAWDWYPSTDWAPVRLGVYDAPDLAKAKCNESFRTD